MKFLGKMFLLLLVLAGAAAAWFWWGIWFPYQGFSGQGVFVDVPHGASIRAAARLLQENGVVRSAPLFEIYARRHATRKLQAGEYFFDRAVSGRDVFWKIANGQIYEQPFTVREGETMFDIARDLEAGKFMTAAAFTAAARNPSLIKDIAPLAPTLEGFLYPATYNLPRHPMAAELTSEMVQKFQQEWARLSAANGSSNVSPETSVFATVTLASLVERETPKPEERPLVAGVFENRLQKNMALQCDPTVIYALEQHGRYNGTLTLADLHTDSPYNTYAHTGLPPGPIGNPGEESLRAALAPANTNFLYFVANTQGGHFFASTLAEHNQNVTKYHRLLAAPSGDAPISRTQPARPNPIPKRQRGAAR